MKKMNLKKGFTLIELLVVVAIIGILASVVLASLNSARSKGEDAKTKGQLSSMRAAMETYYSNGNNNYGNATAGTNGCSSTPNAAPWNDAASGMLNLADIDNYPSGTAGTLVCISTGTAWAAAAQLDGGSGNFFCVDSSGAAKEGTTTAPISDGATPDVTC